MNILNEYRRRSFAEESKRFRRQLYSAVSQSRERLLTRYAELAPERMGQIRTAVEEAECQAWETPFPHLFFPDFAEVQVATVIDGNASTDAPRA